MDLFYQPVVGLEVHAELNTRSKMFCACPVVDTTHALPNTSVCPVCAGMPGVLPVVNQQAVELALRVALALNCTIPSQSIFARKNYFYPDLPKGYQISQYEFPLALYGYLVISTLHGEEEIHIRRVHLEEDTGKLTHISTEQQSYTLVDLNRAGVPLLEIVSEPDLHSVEAVRSYASTLRTLLRYLGVNSGNMEKGVIRFEANVSIRPNGSTTLGTRVEIKNLNSFKALEKSVAYEIKRQTELANKGQPIRQETLGWNVNNEETFSQRGKEEAHDYRYFPEPDLPPLVIEKDWIERVKASQPELPQAKILRFRSQYGLNAYDSSLLVEEQGVADYFENILLADPLLMPKTAANWILGDIFSLMKQKGISIQDIPFRPSALAELLEEVAQGKINTTTAKFILSEMFNSGESPTKIIAAHRLGQISDLEKITILVKQVLEKNPAEVATYLAGKENLSQWFFGLVMRDAKGQANPQLVQTELRKQLTNLRNRLSN